MSYTKISNFGRQNNKKIDATDPANPLTYCLNDSLSTWFMHGPGSSKYNSRCKECQTYLKLRCAGKYKNKETWDDYCQYYFEANKNRYNSARGSNTNLGAVNKSTTEPLSFGEQLLHNAAEEKYIRYPNRKVNFEQFDPMVSNSPYIEVSCNDNDSIAYSGHEVVINKQGLDNDRLMNQMIKYPKAAYNVLARIYEAQQNGTIDISATKLESYLNNNKGLYDQLLERLRNSDPNAQYGQSALGINVKKSQTGCGCLSSCEIPKERNTNSEQCSIFSNTGIMTPCSK